MALLLARMLERLIDTKLKNGKDSAPLLTNAEPCADCRETVQGMDVVVRGMEKSGGRQIELLGEIRDGVRDLRRDADRGITGQWRAPGTPG